MDTTPAPVTEGSNDFADSIASKLGGLFGQSSGDVQPAETTITPAEEAAPAAETPVEEPPAEERKFKPGLDAFDEEPAEEKKEEVKAEEEEPPPGVRTKEAREAWKAGRLAQKEIPKLQAEIAEWKQKAEQAAKLQDAEPLKAKIAELEKRDAEREAEAATWRVEKTKAYQEAVSKPLMELEQRVTALAKELDIPEDKLIDAIQIPDRKVRREKLDALTEDLHTDDRVELANITAKVHDIYKVRDDLERNAAKALAEASAREQEESKTRQTAARAAEMRAVEEMKDSVLKVAKHLVKEGELPEKYVEKVLNEANSVPFDELEAKTKAFAAVAGRLLQDMAPAYRGALDKIAKLEKQIQAMSGSAPRAAGGTQAPAQQKPNGSDDFIAAFMGRASQAGVRVS